MRKGSEEGMCASSTHADYRAMSKSSQFMIHGIPKMGEVGSGCYPVCYGRHSSAKINPHFVYSVQSVPCIRMLLEHNTIDL